jgi:hypothetical protein
MKMEEKGTIKKKNHSSIGRSRKNHPRTYLELNSQTPKLVNQISQTIKKAAVPSMPGKRYFHWVA